MYLGHIGLTEMCLERRDTNLNVACGQFWLVNQCEGLGKSFTFCSKQWAILDSNQGPQSYQDCALTN